ncbi:hypothetical protein [Flavobacterium chungbukense]|uniref:hypothetical protein n=1 Tax=Flavobacterium chungbukense TaxID=877464 RepID=UPI001E3A939D|nr:hypothetical protein [Flavobacterium chungbukense]MCC4923873.1 hypothetical protein [Flavobacterium chungbukense]
MKKKIKKSLKSIVNLNKGSTFAPALRHRRRQKEIHVRRHIELTAVPMQIGTEKIRVMESRDSKRTDRYHRDII